MKKNYINVSTIRNLPEDPYSSLLVIFNENNIKKNYEETLIKWENNIEKKIITLLSNIGITATTKLSRFELPVEFEIIQSNHKVSYLNETFSTNSFFRKIVTELIAKNIYKIRFYIFMEIIDNTKTSCVKYSFRYYVH